MSRPVCLFDEHDPVMINVRTLTDGGQQPLDIAREVASFLSAAQHSLDIALYDLNLGAETHPLVDGALEDAAKRGVAVRLAYNVDFRLPIPVPPPPECVPADIEAIDVPTKPIAGVPDLMHHKYVIRDGASLWTGSMNWTDDSWSREENLYVTIDSPGLAKAYLIDFEQLWTVGDVLKAGKVEPRPIEIGDVEVRPWFSPGYGEERSHRIAKKIGTAKKRVRICSPVLSSGPIIGTLAEVIGDGKVDVAGCADATQLHEVLRQWHTNPNSGWKIPVLEQIVKSGRFSGKVTTPWAPGTVHDYMHAKVTVADDVVFLGSFNLSRSGERNAEDVLEIHDATLADTLATYIESVHARYPVLTL